MSRRDPQGSPAATLVDAANEFYRAAETPGIHMVAPEYLASLNEALRVLSAGWYRVAADAAPGMREEGRARGDGLSLEQEVTLIGTLHDVAAAFALCARACRDGRATVTPVLARKAQAGQTPTEHGRGRAPHGHPASNGTPAS